MKTLILLIILTIFSHLLASDSHWEGAIVEKMLQSMSKDKKPVICSKGTHLNNVIKSMENVQVTDDCKKADFVLADKELVNKSCKRPKIVFSYSDYRNCSNAVGVFFWQKGRPTIRFSSKRLRHFGLEVKGELSKFVSSKG